MTWKLIVILGILYIVTFLEAIGTIRDASAALFAEGDWAIIGNDHSDQSIMSVLHLYYLGVGDHDGL